MFSHLSQQLLDQECSLSPVDQAEAAEPLPMLGYKDIFNSS
jgi:hypothetical protein